MLTVEKAETFDYEYGKATIQRIRGSDLRIETHVVVRLWNNRPQSWLSIPMHSAYSDWPTKIYDRFISDEKRCGGTPVM